MSLGIFAFSWAGFSVAFFISVLILFGLLRVLFSPYYTSIWEQKSFCWKELSSTHNPSMPTWLHLFSKMLSTGSNKPSPPIRTISGWKSSCGLGCLVEASFIPSQIFKQSVLINFRQELCDISWEARIFKAAINMKRIQIMPHVFTYSLGPRVGALSVAV